MVYCFRFILRYKKIVLGIWKGYRFGKISIFFEPWVGGILVQKIPFLHVSQLFPLVHIVNLEQTDFYDNWTSLRQLHVRNQYLQQHLEA